MIHSRNHFRAWFTLWFFSCCVQVAVLWDTLSIAVVRCWSLLGKHVFVSLIIDSVVLFIYIYFFLYKKKKKSNFGNVLLSRLTVCHGQLNVSVCIGSLFARQWQKVLQQWSFLGHHFIWSVYIKLSSVGNYLRLQGLVSVAGVQVHSSVGKVHRNESCGVSERVPVHM